MENNQPQLTVFLPAYREAENLRNLLPNIRSVVADLGLNAEILVIDSKTPLDETPKICQEAGVTYLARRGGNRYGDAVRTGIQASRGEYVITMDSDGSHNPKFIRELWKYREQAEIVIASRYVPGGVTENPWILVAMSQVLNVVFRLVVGMPVYDISNSYRLYRGDLLRRVLPTYANFDILEEILAKLLWCNPDHLVRVTELPFRFEKRKHGKPKRHLIIFAAQFLTALFKLRLLKIQAKSVRRNSRAKKTG